MGNTFARGLLTRLGPVRLLFMYIDGTRTFWPALRFLRKCTKMAGWLVRLKIATINVYFVYKNSGFIFTYLVNLYTVIISLIALIKIGNYIKTDDFDKFQRRECTQSWRILRWLCTHDWPSRRIRVFRGKNTDDTESERERSWRREREKPRPIHVCGRRSSARFFRNTSVRVGSLEEALLCSRETCRECSPGFDVNIRYVYCPPIIQCAITSVSSINAFSPSVSLE